MKDLVIVGTSGFAKEIRWLIDRINNIYHRWNILGYIGDEKNEDLNIIGNDQFLQDYENKLEVILAIGNPSIRKRLYSLYKINSNLCYPSIVDPSVLMSETVRVGQGNIICANTILTTDIQIGDFNIINLDCTIGHGVRLQDYITVNPSVNISGDVFIESMVNIGTGAQIIQGKNVGHNTQIGAGAVVINDIPNNCTVVGIPAKIIKRVRDH